ncbi:hypothetical protein HmCmsJML039_00996 [Escherichia coli]|nr:hypothetical protein HmCmsJML039_00996 [Escherichia coli]
MNIMVNCGINELVKRIENVGNGSNKNEAYR